MIHKLLAGKGKMKRGLSLLLCLALLGSSVISSNVTAEAESDVESVGLSEESDTNADELADEVASDTVETTEENGAEVTETPAEEESTVTVSAMTLTGEADGVSVSVYAPEGSFTESVTMVVSEADTDTFLAAVTADIETEGGTCTVYDSAVVEISFYNANGEEVQPVSAVEVTLSNLDLSTGDNDLTKYAIIYHMDDEGNVDWIEDGDEVGSSSYTFSAINFSTYGVVIASVEYETLLIAGKPGGQDNASGTIKVYYDRITTSGSGDSMTIAAQNDTEGIKSVTITSGGSYTNSGEVVHADGTKNQNQGNWPSTTANITRSSDASVTIEIEPESGYYITFITICCTTNGEPPVKCETYGKGSAYSGSYSISDEGTITITVPLDEEKGFYHNNGTDPYFILIATAKIPSPLYVEYQYGDIVTYINEYNSENGTNISTEVFTGSADTWTDTYDGNVYGTADAGVTYGVMTDDTQYKYTYATGSNSGSAGWKHFANSITAEAIAQAAAAGYYFVGWQATYYTTCTEEDASGNYNNYTYSFSSQYGSSSDYFQPSNEVPLTVHVELVAQWVKVEPDPGTLTITKVVEGLTGAEKENLSITFTVTNSSGETVETVTLPTTSGDWSDTITGLYPGTYTITETGYDVDGYSCVTSSTGGTSSGNPTTVVLSATITRSDTVGSDGLYTYTGTTNNGEVTFTNTYTASPVSLSVTKLVSGNMGDKSKSFTFTLSVKDANGDAYSDDLTYTLNGTENTKQANADGTYTFTLSHQDTIVFTEIPYGYSIEVKETNYAPEGYETTYTVDSGDEQSGFTYTNTKMTADTALVFTNDKTASAPTGLTNDIAPYVAALAIALGGAVLMFISRRRRV